MLRRTILFNRIALVFVLIILARCGKESNPSTGDDGTTPGAVGSISGKVRDAMTGAAMLGVNVGTVPPSSSVQTDMSGDYRIDQVPVGDYNVVAGKAGYKMESLRVSVFADTTSKADFLLRVNTTPQTARLIAIVQKQWGKMVLSALDATEQTQVMITSDNFNVIAGPSWSHNRGRIAFYGKIGDDYGVYIINSDGTGQKKIGTPSSIDDYISWSYNDQSVFFTGQRAWETRDYSVRRYSISDGILSEVSSRMSVPYGYPVASPKQNSVFYRDGISLFLVDLDMGSTRSYGGNGFHFDWSPDGLSIALDNTGMYILRLSDGARTVLSGDEGQAPKYSPDGSRIAYEFPTGMWKIVNSKSGQYLYTIQTNGRHFCWSPDGQKVAYDDAVGYLCVGTPDGQSMTRIASSVLDLDW